MRARAHLTGCLLVQCGCLDCAGGGAGVTVAVRKARERELACTRVPCADTQKLRRAERSVEDHTIVGARSSTQHTLRTFILCVCVFIMYVYTSIICYDIICIFLCIV